MENAALAEAWLEVDSDAQGAVYFDHDGRIMVRARFQKMALPLLASPFADNLEECVVYIDEAHTRGTDLKLPLNAVGAVTLGLGQTKDKTVQAAMRLRQLGSSQSVAFITPPEVHQSIVDLRSSQRDNKNGKKAPKSSTVKSAVVTSVDVVRWLLEQSCKANENMLSLYMAQGMDFCRRINAVWKNSKFTTDIEATNRVLGVIQQREEQTLEALYGTSRSANQGGHFRTKFPLLQGYADQLRQERSDGMVTHSSAFEEVEQEREVEFEVEQVRETQRSTGFKPLNFPGLSDALITFVKTGDLDISKGDFVQAFGYIGGTAIGQKYGVQSTASRLYVTAEFCRTVSTEVVSQDSSQENGKKSRRGKKARAKEGKKRAAWSIVRPVQWILWNHRTETAVVVIPEEAELLLPALRNHPKVHLLTYAAPVTKGMAIFNGLKYFTVPSMKKRDVLPVWLRLEIGILAGRLYLGFDEYQPLLAWLNVEPDHQSSNSDSTGQEASSYAGDLSIEEPLAFLFEWLTNHRQTDDISHTPMGFICQRRRLHEDHTFFSTLSLTNESSSEDELISRKYNATDVTDEDDDSSDTSEEDLIMMDAEAPEGADLQEEVSENVSSAMGSFHLDERDL